MSGMESFHAQKLAVDVPVSEEMLAMAREHAAAMQRWESATPEERAQWAREAEDERRREREAAEPVPMTLDGLIGKLGWTREYAEHFVQPYCECYDGMDGWERCQHAQDLDLHPSG